MFNNVVLPLPDSPVIATNSPILNDVVSESEELTDATIELGKDLFGDALKIE